MAVATCSKGPLATSQGTWPSKVRVVPWVDPVVEASGVAARSPYVERFWLAVLGPSATFLLRHLAAALEAHPEGFETDLAVVARSLGLAPRLSANAPFGRALHRLARFGVLRWRGGTLEVRRRLGPVPHRHLKRLPDELRALHEALSDRQPRGRTASFNQPPRQPAGATTGGGAASRSRCHPA